MRNTENLLKKRLAIIKDRAKRLRELRENAPPPQLWGAQSKPISLSAAAPGEEHIIESCPFYRIRTTADADANEAPEVAENFARVARDPRWTDRFLPAGARRGSALRAEAQDVCFFDIETTGLSPNTYVFLCGTMFYENGGFVIEQLFARDYAEEIGMLLYTRELLGRFDTLVTYNGRSFDVPFITTRMAVGKIDYAGPKQHIDLLYPARGEFADRLPNCRLETIERHLRGQDREGDIPGSEIPEAYHSFVRDGDASRIKQILYHNRMDLLTMGTILNYLTAR
ncbi:MAG: ribonuclease H-like domain-containing protein [Candidatus Latescibacterota bacterium]|nr:MAG: ribonuclease H-like domain-containing protein [Candidatus Latescibacterota bacterium]